MSKPYFCELVSGFFLNLDQTTVVIIYGRSRSIIIEKKWNFCHLVSYNWLIKKVGVATQTQRPIKPKPKLETLRKLVKHVSDDLNSHAKFHGDRTIGGAITVKIALKNTIFV